MASDADAEQMTYDADAEQEALQDEVNSESSDELREEVHLALEKSTSGNCRAVSIGDGERRFRNSMRQFFRIGRQVGTVAVVFAACALCALLAASMQQKSRLPTTHDTVTDPTDFASFYSTLNIDPTGRDPRASNASMAGLSKDHQEVARQLGILKKIVASSTDKQIHDLRTAACVVDSTQAAYFLQRAGLAMVAATSTCRRGKSRYVNAACVTDISTVVASVAFVAEYISEAILQCSKTLHYVTCVYDESVTVSLRGPEDRFCKFPYKSTVISVENVSEMQARCAGGISGIIGNTARLAKTAAMVAANCQGAIAQNSPIGDSVWQSGRRLADAEQSEPKQHTFAQEWPNSDQIQWSETAGGRGGDNSIHQTVFNRANEIYTCSLDAAQTTAFLADFGIFIDGATKACGPSKYPTGLLHPHMRDAHNVWCAMTILDALESVFMASSFIASALAHCAPADNQEALCVAGATGIAGGVSGLGKSITNVIGTCQSGAHLKNFLDPKYMSDKGTLLSYEAAKKATVWNDVPGRRRPQKVFGPK